MASEGARKGIRVNCVRPGATHSATHSALSKPHCSKDVVEGLMVMEGIPVCERDRSQGDAFAMSSARSVSRFTSNARRTLRAEFWFPSMIASRMCSVLIQGSANVPASRGER